nr:tRNA (guanosine(37)-N1)-methyltransferase TrmD [Porphyromonas sp.]
MRIDILTVVPELLESPLQHSIVGRAQQQGFLELHVHNIRDYATNKWRRVDDYPFGGEAGMILQIEPIDRVIADLKSQRHYDEVIYTSPDGETFDQGIANQMSLQENLIILCGHYKGIDQRIREHLITREISVGDYVLTGGELPAAIMVDAVVRLLPGVIGDAESALSDTFQDDLLAPPIHPPRRLQGVEGARRPPQWARRPYRSVEDGVRPRAYEAPETRPIQEALGAREIAN